MRGLWLQPGEASLRFWVSALWLLVAAGAVALAARLAPAWLTAWGLAEWAGLIAEPAASLGVTLLASALAASGLACVWLGMRCFAGRRPGWWLPLLFVAGTVPLGLAAWHWQFDIIPVEAVYLLLLACVAGHLCALELEEGHAREAGRLPVLANAAMVCKSFGLVCALTIPFAIWEHVASGSVDKMAASGLQMPWWTVAFALLALLHGLAAAFATLELARERTAARLDDVASVDQLTGLANRAAFAEQVAADLARGDHLCGSFLILDLDRHKSIRDSHGHRAADTVLKALADFLKAFAADRMTCGRIGDEEFGIYISGLAGSPADLLGQQICLGTSMLKPKVGDETLAITVSIGFTDTVVSGRSYDDLYDHSACALYEAKKRGRNTSCRYAADLKTKAFADKVTASLKLIA